MKKSLSLFSALALLAFASACAKDPAQPTPSSSSSTPTAQTSSTDSASGVTLVSPGLLTPASLAQIPNSAQPITLTITNGLSTGKTTPTYLFQVASDSAFSSIVYSKDGVAQGANGQTSLTIDTIGAGKSYFWRSRTNSGSAAGLFSAVRGFTVGPAVVLQAPILSDPASGATVDVSPTLTINNVQRTGPAGNIVYRIDISMSSAFSPIAYSGTAAENSGQPTTQVAVTTPLAEGNYFWRAQATDTTNSVNSPLSATGSFTAKKTPPFDMRQAAIYNSPPDLGFWPQTSAITSIVFTPDAMEVDFDKRQGPNEWEDTPFGDGALQYTLGMCLFINNQWDCSAVVQFWNGRDLDASGVPAQFAQSWFYDPARWGPMTGHQPVAGEIIGVFAASGNLRNASFTQVDCPRICERTNVALVPYPGDYQSATVLSAGKAIRLNTVRKK